jgi:hypothetical protein
MLRASQIQAFVKVAQSRGVKNSKKQTTKRYKSWFPNTPKIPNMLLYYY